MQDVFNLTTPQHWKALSHPLRARLLLLVHEREMTNAELADAIGIPSGQLHFHTRQLLNAGMIEIVGTRMKGPITEKLYRATAKRYSSEHMPPGFGSLLEPALVSGLEFYRKYGRDAADAPTVGTCVKIPMNREVAEQFQQRLQQLARDLIAQAEASGSTDEASEDKYAFTLVMHRMSREPTEPDSGDPGDSEDEK